MQTFATGDLGDYVLVGGFALLFIIPFAIYLVLVLSGRVKLPPAKARGAGRRLLGPFFVGGLYWMYGPAFRFLRRSSVTPNQVTLVSLVVTLVAGVAIATGHFLMAALLVFLGGSLDIVDGQLARAKKLQSAAGAFLDSTTDRLGDGFIFGGCVIYYAGTWAMPVGLGALVLTFAVSYARARGEALGVSGAEGLVQRAERILILGAALLFSPLVSALSEPRTAHPFYALTAAALCLLAALNLVTVVARIAWTMKRLAKKAPAAPSTSSPSLVAYRPTDMSSAR
jgi:phosphatidylglycerophosphate synthase